MNTHARRILIVDDNPDDRSDIRRMLLCGSGTRYRFTEAAMGREGLRLLQQQGGEAFDCVLLDYHLPDMDALDVLAALGGPDGRPPAPVVVLTGSDRPAGSSLLRAGAQDYLGKGWLSAESLTRAVDNAVERFALAAAHRRTQAALRDSEARLALGIQVAGLALMEIDYDADLNHLSAEAAQLFGLGTEALTLARAAVHARIHPDDRAALLQRVARSLDPAGPGWFAADHRVLWPSGEVRWVRVRKQVRFSGQGATSRARYATVAALDVTQEKAAMDALQHSEERFRGTFENAAIGMAHIGLDGRWLRANRVMCRITGYSEPELAAMTFADITHAEDVTADAAQAQQMLAGGIDSYAMEKRYLRKDGSIVWVNLTVALLRDAAGRPLHFISAVEDITEKRAALQELERQRRFVERLTNVMPHVLYVHDLEQQRNTWVNRPIGSLLGYSAEALAGLGLRPQRDLRHPDDLVQMPATFAKIATLRDGEVQETEFRLRDPMGGWRWFHSSDTVFSRTGDGAVREIIGTAMDVTERKRVQSQLSAATAVAEKASLAKSEFLSRMSHELRTPLNAILGFAQLMEQGATPPTPSQARSIRQIIKGGWYLLDLVNEVLDLTQIESGNLSIANVPTALATLLLECQAMTEPLAAQRAIGIVFTAPPKTCLVLADRKRLTQVLINLLSNAIKYNRPQGTVVIDCAQQVPGWLRISVRDTGEGLSREQLAQLFEPFNRLGQEGKGTQGTGIGLVVSKHLVELMGGSIGAHSTPGSGSIFWVELPVVEPATRLPLAVPATAT